MVSTIIENVNTYITRLTHFVVTRETRIYISNKFSRHPSMLREKEVEKVTRYSFQIKTPSIH